LVFSLIHLTPQPPLHAVERGSGGEVLEKVSSPQLRSEEESGGEVNSSIETSYLDAIALTMSLIALANGERFTFAPNSVKLTAAPFRRAR